MARTTIHLVRHGEQDPGGGHLSGLGRDQAERLGRRLLLREPPFTRIHHSPSERAAETAGIISAHLPGVPVHACDFVADRTPAPAPGQESAYPERYRRWLGEVPETERDRGAARLRAAVAHLGVVGTADRDELVVTHNFVIGWFVRHVLDAPEWRWLGLDQANCGLTVVAWETGRPPALVSFNDTGHLAGRG